MLFIGLNDKYEGRFSDDYKKILEVEFWTCASHNKCHSNIQSLSCLLILEHIHLYWSRCSTPSRIPHDSSVAMIGLRPCSNLPAPAHRVHVQVTFVLIYFRFANWRSVLPWNTIFISAGGKCQVGLPGGL